MKKDLRFIIAPLLALVISATAGAQALLPDQNPQYMFSQQKYIRMMDSINAWHGTTPQETYKAIDYLADKQEARELRRAARRELRLERARNGGYYYNDYYANPGFYGYYGGYRRPWNSWNNYGWGLATGIGLGSWWWR